MQVLKTVCPFSQQNQSNAPQASDSKSTSRFATEELQAHAMDAPKVITPRLPSYLFSLTWIKDIILCWLCIIALLLLLLITIIVMFSWGLQHLLTRCFSHMANLQPYQRLPAETHENKCTQKVINVLGVSRGLLISSMAHAQAYTQ